MTALDHYDDRAAALVAVDHTIAKLMALYDDMTAAKADAAKPVFVEALVGDGRPRFSAETIAKGLRDVLTGWRRQKAPQAADIAAACAGYHRQTPTSPAIAATSNRRPRCDLCGAERRDDGTYAQGTLGLYRDAGPGAANPWQRDEHACGHSRAWLHGRNTQGWSTLSQLPAHERHVAVGGPELAGPLATLVDRLGDKMGRGRGT